MADISASAERRAELMMRDAELEAENMLLEAKVNVRKLNDEHDILSAKVRRLKDNFRKMLQAELERLDGDDFDIIRDLSDAVDIPAQEAPAADSISKAPTIVMDRVESDAPVAADFSVPVTDLEHATVSDLSDGLKAIAEDASAIDNTIILK
jgi:hypothetical protein